VEVPGEAEPEDAAAVAAVTIAKAAGTIITTMSTVVVDIATKYFLS